MDIPEKLKRGFLFLGALLIAATALFALRVAGGRDA
jgi:hypothetical protein